MNLSKHFILRISIAMVLLAASAMPFLDARASLPAATSALTFKPAADSYVRAAYPGMNYGTAAALRVDGSPDAHGYLRFTVSGLNGRSISRATLRLYSNASNAAGAAVKMVASNTWGETTVTYGNKPALGTTLSSSGAIPAAGWVSLNVTSYVKAGGTYSFGVVTPGSIGFSFASRESGLRSPQLVLTLGSSGQPSFPIRAAFYYPWFPSGWTQLHHFPYTNFDPQLGYYSSSNLTTLKKHIQMMQYAHIQAGIASWWGQGSYADKNVPYLLNAASGTSFHWALYYELESTGDPSVNQIRSDLTYIRDHYAVSPNFLRVNGKFVVFVYTSGSDGCAMAGRWKQANTVGAYIVMKVFSGYATCAYQPDSWHQYAPAGAEHHVDHYSYSISPGFWKYGESPRLSRSVTRWTQNVKDMIASRAQWQLITTFSEWGEGTAVEPATQWASPSGYGQYLDALHYNGSMP